MNFQNTSRIRNRYSYKGKTPQGRPCIVGYCQSLRINVSEIKNRVLSNRICFVIKMESIKIKRRKITVEEYQALRRTTDWFQLADDVVEKSLDNDLFSVCVLDDDKLVGIGRIVGDGAIYFYIQDIIVIPQYQNKGIGTMIMNGIEAYLENNTYNCMSSNQFSQSVIKK